MEKNFIVLVEDNPDDQVLIMRVLKKYRVSNEIIVFQDGAEAVDFLLQAQGNSKSVRPLPELVLLDFKLPKLSGIEVLRRIRENERTKRLPVVVLTSSKEEGRALEKDQLGPSGYVCKPVDFAQLSDAVQKAGLSWMLLNKSPAAKS